MVLFNAGLVLLLVDAGRRPDWYPIELFEVEDGRLPDNWTFAARDGGRSGRQAVWGHR